MKNYYNEIKSTLDADPKYRDRLFCRGYLLTDAELDCVDSYPFYGQWKHHTVGGYHLYVHPLENGYVYNDGEYSLALIGYACNPYTDEIDEIKILEQLLSCYRKSNNAFYDMLDELTGVFVLYLTDGKELIALQDCSGPKGIFFGKKDEKAYFSSTPQLSADVMGLKVEPKIETLVDSRGYKYGSGFLPGNLTPFQDIKRLGCNTLLRYRDGQFKIERFFPRAETPNVELKTEEERVAQVEEMHRILSKSITLLLQKFSNVGLSLSGGMDSRGELACTAPDYDRVYIFSFHSKDSEKIDADAAAQICAEIGQPHHLYAIPENENEIEDYDFLQKVIEHSNGYTCKIHPNEKRKFIWLQKNKDFDAELKADVSEIGRAFANRKYHKVNMPRVLAPRHFTIVQGRYFLEARKMHFCDKAFRDFMQETGLTDDMYGYTMQDLFYWEVKTGSWASTVYTMQCYMQQILMAYNNRNLMKMFLRFPEEERKKDEPHWRLIARGDQRLKDIQLQVKDSYLGKKRMFVETTYYYYATRLNTMGEKRKKQK